jgi:CubicO group peptidase (beta-lactamase class C family)
MMNKALTLLLLVASTNLQAQTLSMAGRYELDRYLAESVAQSHIPGLVALVTNGEEVIYHSAFGVMDSGNSKAMTRDAIFRIASMTKPVTSLAVMMLVEEGRVGLDDPIEDYLPDLANRSVVMFISDGGIDRAFSSARNKITVRHLLTHTSGLGYTFDSPVLAKLLEGNPGASATTVPLLHEPGERWTYGESTRVLGHLVEAVSGQALFVFMKERILDPLGMVETTYDIPAEKNARTVTVHRSNGSELVEDANPAGIISSPHNGDGGLSSTADDYSRFIRLFLNGGIADSGERLVSADTVAAMGRNHMGDLTVGLMPTTNRLLSEEFPLGAGVDTFGLGFQVTEQQLDNSRAPGSMAWAGIYNTEFWIDPDTHIGAVLMMQYLPFYDAKAIEVLQGFENRIYGNLD